jgi:hypothetical protein
MSRQVHIMCVAVLTRIPEVWKRLGHFHDCQITGHAGIDAHVGVEDS